MTKSYEGIYYVTCYISWCDIDITSNNEQYDYHIKLLKRFNKHSKNNKSHITSCNDLFIIQQSFKINLWYHNITHTLICRSNLLDMIFIGSFVLTIFYVYPSKPIMGCHVSKQLCHDQPSFSIFNIDINKQKIVLIFEKIRIVTWFTTEKVSQCIIPCPLHIYHYMASRKFAICTSLLFYKISI